MPEGQNSAWILGWGTRMGLLGLATQMGWDTWLLGWANRMGLAVNTTGSSSPK